MSLDVVRLTEDLELEREIVQGIKLTEEAESALLRCLRLVIKQNSLPHELTFNERNLVIDFKKLLSYRKQARKHINDLYVKERTALVPEAEAMAYIDLRESGDNDLPDWEDRWNRYFHKAMKKLVFERLGIKEESYGTREISR